MVKRYCKPCPRVRPRKLTPIEYFLSFITLTAGAITILSKLGFFSVVPAVGQVAPQPNSITNWSIFLGILLVIISIMFLTKNKKK